MTVGHATADSPPPDPARSPRAGRLALCLFGTAALVYFITGNGHLQTTDMYSELSVAQSIADRGDFAVDPGVTHSAGVDGRDYSKYGVGQSLLLVPAVLAGRVLPHRGAASATQFVASFLDGAMAAVTVALVFLTAVEVGAGVRAAAAVALVLAFATITWSYAHDSFDIGPTTTFLVLALYAVMRAGRSPRLGWLLLGGAVTGFAVLMRVSSLVDIPFLFGLLAWRLRGLGWSAAAALATWLVPLVAALFFLGWYNWVRFGLPLETGYGLDVDPVIFTMPSLDRLGGLLLSPGKSLFLFSPPLLLGLVGLPAFWRRHRAVAVTVFAIVAANLGLFSGYNIWSGDWAWGPRFMVPLAPLMLLPAIMLFEPWRAMRRWFRVAIIGLCLAGTAVQALGVSLDFYHQMGIMAQHNLPVAGAVWDPSMSAVWRHFGALRDLLAGSAEYPTRFAGYDLAGGRPTSTTWDLWWNYALIDGAAPAVVWGTLSASLVLLGALGAWLIREMRASGSALAAGALSAARPASVG